MDDGTGHAGIAPAQWSARVGQLVAMSVMSFMSFETFGGP
ncbi:tRNA U34 5-carboxymethylaminomethyl modifying enzyme MnmG/GidA [Xanthomonas sp. 3376]|nr:tRNA U34 5-carboxymethylaminomethyl modifying enzyme MnmG/GidA [Xanthomonas arboricola]